MLLSSFRLRVVGGVVAAGVAARHMTNSQSIWIYRNEYEANRITRGPLDERSKSSARFENAKMLFRSHAKGSDDL